jgi:hypothetical protein
MNFRIELERRDDGSWLAEVVGSSCRMGALGGDRLQALRRAQAHALRFLAGQLDREGSFSPVPPTMNVAFDVL